MPNIHATARFERTITTIIELAPVVVIRYSREATMGTAHATCPFSDHRPRHVQPSPCSTNSGPAKSGCAGIGALGKEKSPLLERAILASFPARAVELGRVWAGEQHDFFFAVRTHSKPQLVVDNGPKLAMNSVPGTDSWYAAPTIEHLGTLHSFHYVIDGKPFGETLTYRRSASCPIVYPV